MHPRFSMTTLTILLAAGALACYAIFRLYARWMDRKPDGKHGR